MCYLPSSQILIETIQEVHAGIALQKKGLILEFAGFLVFESERDFNEGYFSTQLSYILCR